MNFLISTQPTQKSHHNDVPRPRCLLRRPVVVLALSALFMER